LFLAELHAATGAADARRTCLGALRQALSCAEAVPPRSRLSLYIGWIGVALAAGRAGAVLDEGTLVERAGGLLRRLRRAAGADEAGGEVDLLGGCAGAIVGLLSLRGVLHDPGLLEWAVRLGEHLLRTAERSDAGYSWRSPRLPDQRNLAGLSHGTAGIGHALLELSVAAADTRFRDAAEQAFRYERAWFDPAEENWPDFREQWSGPYRPRSGPARRRPEGPLAFSTLWCHGAPGIALSRLNASRLLGDATCRAEALAALRTTGSAVERALQSAVWNYSLCHGLAGNAEVLMDGHRLLGPAAEGAAALALRVAHAGIERYGAAGRPWPCGTVVGETPGLLLGLAGIGYFYLRLQDPLVPSVLLPRGDGFPAA
jgi:lantibiotic modifying enzyme